MKVHAIRQNTSIGALCSGLTRLTIFRDKGLSLLLQHVKMALENMFARRNGICSTECRLGAALISVPVKWTPLMLKRSWQNVKVEDYRNVRVWVDLEDIAPVMVRAILASEDGRFMEHNGFDLQELRKMKREHEAKGKKIRGAVRSAST